MPARLTRETLTTELAHLEHMLATTPDEAPTARLMWGQRLLAVRRQLESVDSASQTSASVALIFDGLPVLGARDIRADFAARILGEYQHLVAAVFADHVADQLRARGPLPNSAQSRLFIAEIAHGSMGFILEEAPKDQVELVDTPLKHAVEDVSALLRDLSADDLNVFASRAEALRPRVFKAVKEVAKTLSDFAAETRIVGQELTVEIPELRARRLHDRLTDTLVAEERVAIRGMLTGLLPDRSTFEFRLDDVDQTDIYGAVAEDMAGRYLLEAASLVQRHGTANFLKVSTIRSGLVVHEQFVLEGFAPDEATETSDR